MEIYTITPTLERLDLRTPIPGYERFIGAYMFCGEKTAIIDIGPKAAIPNLMSALARLSIGPEANDYIVLTHIHMDHAGGVGAAIKEMSRAKVVAHGRARPHLVDPTALWQASKKALGDLAYKYGEIEPVSEDRIIVAEDCMELDLGRGLVLEIYHTTGHASHHMSIFDRSCGVLIAGEAAGVWEGDVESRLGGWLAELSG